MHGKSGVPLGSIRGPLSFSVHVNELFNAATNLFSTVHTGEIDMFTT